VFLPGVLLVVVVFVILRFTPEGHQSQNELRAHARVLVDRLAPGPALDYKLSVSQDCFQALPEASRDGLQAIVTDVLREALPDATSSFLKVAPPELRRLNSNSPHSVAEARHILVWDNAHHTNNSRSATQGVAPTAIELIDMVTRMAESRIPNFKELCPGLNVFTLLPIEPVVDDAEDVVVEVVDDTQESTAMAARSNDAPSTRGTPADVASEGATAGGSLSTNAGGSDGSMWLVWLLLPIGVVIFGAALVMMCKSEIGFKLSDIRWSDIGWNRTKYSTVGVGTVGFGKVDPIVEQHHVNLIVVPGGGLSSGQPSPWVEERLREAKAVYDSARVSGRPDRGMPRIITHNSASPSQSREPSSGVEADICSKYLVEKCGVPQNDVIVENLSFSLIGNAYFARVLHADAKKVRHVVVVTNRFQMNRAMAVFSAIFALKPLPKGRDDGYVLSFREAPDRGLDSETLAALHEQESHALRKFEELKHRFTCLSDVHDFLLGAQGSLGGKDLEFRVVLDKTSGRKIGATLGFHGDVVEITEVTGDLMQKWNEDHPKLAVKRGDRIAEVNGVKEWWTQNRVLELVVKRPVQADCNDSRASSGKRASRGLRSPFGWAPGRSATSTAGSSITTATSRTTVTSTTGTSSTR
jgi:hypothetical protein